MIGTSENDRHIEMAKDDNMLNQQLYPAIFERKSIRKYMQGPLPVLAIAALRQFLSSVQPLDETIKTRFYEFGPDEITNLLPVPGKAPHYISLYSEKTGNYLLNAGFILQQVDLYCSSQNIGSCWLGLAKPHKQVQLVRDGLAPLDQDGLVFVTMLAFGTPDEPVHRTSPEIFKRKSLNEIANITDVGELLEPARLAPSGNNAQPWFFSGTTSEIVISCKRSRLLHIAIIDRMNQIDIGIALCHLCLSISARGQRPEVSYEAEPAPDGYQFMAKIKVLPG
jgi:nitroreductase